MAPSASDRRLKVVECQLPCGVSYHQSCSPQRTETRESRKESRAVASHPAAARLPSPSRCIGAPQTGLVGRTPHRTRRTGMRNPPAQTKPARWADTNARRKTCEMVYLARKVFPFPGARAGPRRARGTCAVRRALVSGLPFSWGMALLSGVALGSSPAFGTLGRVGVDTRMAGE